MTKKEIEKYLKRKPAQKVIYEYLLGCPNGSVGAVRTNQRARGYKDESSCSGEALRPLYALVDAGIVSFVYVKNDWGQMVRKYYVV